MWTNIFEVTLAAEVTEYVAIKIRNVYSNFVTYCINTS